MKKIIMFLFVFIMLSLTSWTQNNKILLDTSQFEITNITELAITIDNLSFANDNQPNFQDTLVQKGGRSSIANLNLKVASGDLRINFDLVVEAEEYHIVLEKIINLDTKKEFPLYPEHVYGDHNKYIPRGEGTNKTITIANNASNANPFLLAGKIKILLRVESLNYRTYYGKFWNTKVKCNRLPLKWYQKEKVWIPPLVVTGVGVGLILWDKDYQPVYDRYRAYPRNIAATEADYNEAIRIRRNERRNDALGIGLITASVAWVGIQLLRDKERKNTCVRYCCKGNEHCGKCKKKKKKKRKGKKIDVGFIDPSSDILNAHSISFDSNLAIGIKYTF